MIRLYGLFEFVSVSAFTVTVLFWAYLLVTP